MNISFVMSVRPSVRPSVRLSVCLVCMEHLGSRQTEFCKILYWGFITKTQSARMFILASIPQLDVSAPPSYWQVATGHVLIRDPYFKTTYIRVEKPEGKFLHENFNI